MPSNAVTVRQARREDLPAIVDLLHQDELYRPTAVANATVDAAISSAFEVIASDPNNQVFVAALLQGADAAGDPALAEGRVVGTFQLTFIRQLTYGGSLVAQVESVFVHPSVRSQGVGTSMMTWAMEEARRRGCIRVQLTSNEVRTDAHRFYDALGFRAPHRGMKLLLV